MGKGIDLISVTKMEYEYLIRLALPPASTSI
jgi:hypothetical protein